MSKVKASVPQPQAAGLPTVAPEWMLTEPQADFGVSELVKYIVPPRLKVVQPLSNTELKTVFNEGDAVIVPQMSLLAPIKLTDNHKPSIELGGEPFNFIPVFFFAEWLTWNPIEMKGALPAIRDRSLDPKSPLAFKARSQATWFEPCPEKRDFNVRHVEHLNFLVMLVGEHELADTPFIISFSRSGHKDGSNLAQLIKMRKAPIYGCQFEGRVTWRENSKGQWWGVACTNPSTVPSFVTDQALYNALKAKNKEFAEAHSGGIIRPEYDDPGEAPGVVGNAPNQF